MRMKINGTDHNIVKQLYSNKDAKKKKRHSLPTLYNVVLDIVVSEVRQENNIRNGKEEMKLS